jgi:hypothetical protein
MLAPLLLTAVVTSRSFRSQCEFDVAFGGVDADPDVLSGGLGHFT